MLLWASSNSLRFAHLSNSTSWTYGSAAKSTCIRPALPAYLFQDSVFEPTPIQQHNKQWQTQRRQRAVDKRKIRLRHTPVKSEEITHPKQGKHPPRTKPLQRMVAKLRIPHLY